jgi:flagellar motor protein MotB
MPTKENLESSSENPFWISISDLMTGLLIIFILALLYYILNFSSETKQLQEEKSNYQQTLYLIQKKHKIRSKLLNLVQKKLKEAGFLVKIDPDHGILHLEEGILFDSGKAELKEKGKKLLSVLSFILYDLLNKPEFKQTIETIFIEGHTDNIPIKTAKFPSNWELSTERAISTWRYLVSTNKKLEKLKNINNQFMFSCSGYSDTRPIDTNDTPKGRLRNRRIDFRFTLTSPKTFSSIKNNIKVKINNGIH